MENTRFFKDVEFAREIRSDILSWKMNTNPPVVIDNDRIRLLSLTLFKKQFWIKTIPKYLLFRIKKLFKKNKLNSH